MNTVLTIAGSDSCGGAGVQVDLKTIHALGAYGVCAVTAITAQNTLGVNAVHEVIAEVVGQQIDAVISDIGADAVKTGMLTNEGIVEVVADRVQKHDLKKLVVDPIISSHKGERLLSVEGVTRLRTALIPLSFIITPNIPEAGVLAGRRINNLSDMKDAAKSIYELGPGNVLIKGGHAMDRENRGDTSSNIVVVDVLYDGNSFECFEEEQIQTVKVHGTGCIYSTAIAVGLAMGKDLLSSITNAKKFVTEMIKRPLTIGKGHRLADL